MTRLRMTCLAGLAALLLLGLGGDPFDEAV